MRRGSSNASLASSVTTASQQPPAPSESSSSGGLLPGMPSWPRLRRRRPRGSRRHWVEDQKVDACMLCSAPFTLTYRKHHCRRCGKVICGKCSHFVDAALVFSQNGPSTTSGGTAATAAPAPVTAALTAVATAPAALLPKDTTRVCGPCGAALTVVVHDPAAQAKAAVESAILATPAYVYIAYEKKEELAVGALSVVVVQARGLPVADRNGLSDPYAKLTLTGLTITGGQEWPEEWQTSKRTATRFATLNPIWKEHFVLRVPRAEAVLRVDVKDYDFGLPTDDALGQAAIPLGDLLHQRRVDRWYPLVGEDGEEKGEIRLILQFCFNRWGEALSRFWAEPPRKPDWPGFSPNRTFDHVKNLMVETQLYTNFLQAVAAVLKWERPLWTLAWLAVVLGLTLRPRFIYSGLQLLLALHLVATYIRRRGRAQTLELEQATAGRRRLTIRELMRQRRLRAVLRGGMSDTDTVDAKEQKAPAKQPQQPQQADRGADADGAADPKAAAAAAEEETRRQQQQQQEEAEGIQSLGFLLNILGKRLGRSEATTNLQNALGMLVALLRGIRQLLEWEYPPVTLGFFLVLLGSAALHCYLATTYLFIIAELAVFGVLTWPLATVAWLTSRNLRVARSLAVQLGYALKRGDVDGQISEEAYAHEVQGLAAPTEAVGEGMGGGDGGFGEAKGGEEGAEATGQ